MSLSRLPYKNYDRNVSFYLFSFCEFCSNRILQNLHCLLGLVLGSLSSGHTLSSSSVNGKLSSYLIRCHHMSISRLPLQKLQQSCFFSYFLIHLQLFQRHIIGRSHHCNHVSSRLQSKANWVNKHR